MHSIFLWWQYATRDRSPLIASPRWRARVTDTVACVGYAPFQTPPPPVGPAPLRCIHGVSQSAEMYIFVDILKTCMYMQNFIYKY